MLIEVSLRKGEPEAQGGPNSWAVLSMKSGQSPACCNNYPFITTFTKKIIYKLKKKKCWTSHLKRYQVRHWLTGQPFSLWISSLHRGNTTCDLQGVAEETQSCDGPCPGTGLSSLLWLLERLDLPRPLGQRLPGCYLGEPRRASKGFGSRGLLPISFYLKPPGQACDPPESPVSAGEEKPPMSSVGPPAAGAVTLQSPR